MSKQISDAELKIAGLENKKAYLERNLKESETNLREMVAARRLNRWCALLRCSIISMFSIHAFAMLVLMKYQSKIIMI